MQPTGLARAAARGEWGVIFTNPIQELRALVKMWAGNNALLIIPFVAGLWLLVRRALTPEEPGRSLLIPMVLVMQPVVWAALGGGR